ncbi:MAG: hypothetical protein JSR39_05310 [Verrucomicrobia bacterium]|nr:hypothetical protein [Verrucomicrobiota bacterium]
MDNPLVISFYTLDTPYQEEVKRLIASCRHFDIDHHIEGIKSHGSWLRNVAMKPAFIAEKLLQFRRPLFWVDADGAFKNKPQFEQFYEFDVAVREVDAYRDDPWMKLHAGSIFINYNPKMVRFVKDWVQVCKDKINEDIVNLFFLDQTSLLHMIEHTQGLKVGKLPIGYCKVFDAPAEQIDPSSVVIEQYQASRRLKDLI